jgi:hypothetical protein
VARLYQALESGVKADSGHHVVAVVGGRLQWIPLREVMRLGVPVQWGRRGDAYYLAPRVGCVARWRINLWRTASKGGGGVESGGRRRG